MLYVVGFIVTFVIGGLTGRDHRRGPARPAAARHLLRRRPLPLRADRRRGVPAARRSSPTGIPKITGRMMGETLGKIGFWMLFLGFQLAFFPMHFCGPARHAAAGLHLPGRPRPGASQPAVDHRRVRGRRRRAPVRHQRHRLALPRRDRAAPTRGTRRASNGRPARRRRSTISPISRSSKRSTPLWDSRRRAAGRDRPSRRREGDAADHRRRGDARPARAGARSRACGRSSRPARSAIVFVTSIFSPWALAVRRCCRSRSR